MNKQNFNEAYKDKGGIEQLEKFRDQRASLKIIAEHFGVSRTAVELWFKKIYNINYDPRRERKEERIKKMLEYARNHTQEEFKEKYKKSQYYYHIALAKCYQLKIYK